ncbi:SPT2 [Geosmithia morbida]|uniref:SPT2 n=1 Tax=Geosmithia morbida TaxID=1094350 RepID=A0A9P5D0N9_9HYPO|nr:SPT2 [Geosmithia morbida]KAF4122943.1 SPT2 [Geosmithia morbida]
MPISDLLNSISGTTPSVTKRKAEDDPKPASKIARKSPPQPSSKPAQPRPQSTNSPKTISRPSNGSGLAPRPGPTTSQRTSAKPPVSVKPSSSLAPTADASKVPPKKGSYAEVLARAKKAQEVMGQVGKIQHKKADKIEKADRRKAPVGKAFAGNVPAGKAPTRTPDQKAGASSTGYQGTARPLQDRAAAPGARGRLPAKTGAPRPSTAKEESEVPVKKVKKAATATLGYTGTARPSSSNPRKTQKDQPRGGALLNRKPSRPSGSGRSHYDEYDEELDDFIEYDEDEEEDVGPRYDYASDGSSDMEAGIDELTGEERLAEIIARREDIEEERRDRIRKAEKAERLRKAMGGGRS